MHWFGTGSNDVYAFTVHAHVFVFFVYIDASVRIYVFVCACVCMYTSHLLQKFEMSSQEYSK